MVRSMTGYGRKETMFGALRLSVEMRAVNHRFCEIQVRLPKAYAVLEDPVRRAVAEYVRRGRVDVTVSIEEEAAAETGFDVNWEVAGQYVKALREMKERFSLSEPLSAKDLLLMPGVIAEQEAKETPPEAVAEPLLSVVREASQELLLLKQKEGQKLEEDLKRRLAGIVSWTKEIAQHAPGVVEEYRARLMQRVQEWAQSVTAEIDEQRLAQEAVLFADRSDISEEITRLESHAAQFAEQLEQDEAVGRKLDFYLQEMNREANTIASKANHLLIQRLAIEIKTELEKMREQVQNIE
ncbi:YicC family protein [Brevibacillus composti]|uniref:YicC family protein n=1 Tax=Brevibacillus composti TaxID=2796470 RepID=A0A7T5ENT5_9BACL|nr:YicC/YloC family endoribonuclease [Brevibacillus composti]QQE75997.1 YicC family protein [Brevibacillus composti]QUO43023.1 YicC family protein [Brevibacillus composti]